MNQKILNVLNGLEIIEEHGGKNAYILVENNEKNQKALNDVGVATEVINQYGDEETFCVLALAFGERYATGYKNGGLVYNPGLGELANNVEKWSADKGLDIADSNAQFVKVVEEVGEVAGALARGNEYELKDGIGDVVVTLIILAQQNGFTLRECLQAAYEEIADRKGKMINGVFIKESDL